MLPKLKFEGHKGKKSNHVVAALGAGMYVTDSFRAELDLTNHFNVQQKFSKSSVVEVDGEFPAGTTILGQAKPKFKVTSLHLKGLFDVYDFGPAKAFVGAGVGLSQVNAKAPINITIIVPGLPDPVKEEVKLKAKKKNNFSYLATVGGSFDVAEGVKAEVAYTYTNHGSTKNLVDQDNVKYDKIKLKTHAVTAGVRIDL